MRAALGLVLLALLSSVAHPASSGALGRPGGAVVLVFDDGCASHLRAAAALEARQVRGTFFVVAGPAPMGTSCGEHLTDEEVASLASRGHEIGSHGMTHSTLTTLSDAALREELVMSQARLRAHTGQSVLHFAYPYGETDARVTAAAAEVYSSARVFERSRPGEDAPFETRAFDTEHRMAIPSFGVERSTTPQQARDQIDLARTRGVTIALVFHDISDAPADFDATSAMLDTVLDHALASGLPVLTLGQAMGDVQFRPRQGNGWWVQTSLLGPDARLVTKVEARDDNGPWTPLARKSWGDFAASFRVEPGHAVRYRATLGDGRVVDSCPYAHPSGTCVGASANGSSGAPSSPRSPFAASFQNVRGNTWWVETDVKSSGGAIAGVDARVDGGPWRALDLRSYGSWAKSLRAPAGTSVEFRASGPEGATIVSPAFTWPPR